MKKLIILLGVAGTAFSAIFVRSSDALAIVLVFYRMLFAVLLLLPGMVLSKKELQGITIRELGMCAISGIFLGMHFICYFLSLQYTGIASAVVLVDTEVFFVALGGAIFFKEKVYPLVGLSIGVTFAGSVIVACGDMSGGGFIGDIIALGGALCSAVYTLIGRRCRKQMSTTVYTWIVYFLASIVALMACIFNRPAALLCGRKDLLLSLGLTVVCTLLGHSIFSWGLKYERASFISTVKLLEPVFAAALGALIFREVPLPTSVTGGLIIIAGIILCINGNRQMDSAGEV